MRARIASWVALAIGLTSSLSFGQSPAVITYPAGIYSVQFAVPTPFAGPFVISQTATSITISWGTAPVPPIPPPIPPAPPPPVPVPIPVVPVGTHVWAVAIIDPAQTLSAAQVAALTSPTLKRSAELLNVSFEAHSKLEDSPNVKSYLVDVKSFPSLVFITPGSTPEVGVIPPGAIVPLPASEADILAVINKARGK